MGQIVTVEDMLQRMERVNPTEVLGEAIEQTRQEALELNRIQLFQKGEKADGTKLAPYKSKAYAKKKAGMNPFLKEGEADGRLTGEMYREMFVDVQGDKAVFDSVSPHATMMIKRDGPAIFGLSEDSMQEYRPTVMGAAVEIIKEQTGLI